MKEEAYRNFSNAFHETAVEHSETGRVPIEGMVELTRLCSLKCTHCYIGDARWTKDPAELSTQQLKELFDQLAARGTLWLTLTGGEALMRKDFKELWLYAKQKGFILTLFTNATLISRELADFLVANPPLTIEVSIYGATEATFEAVSQVKGSHKRFLRGVQNLIDAGLPWKLKTVLIRENAHELEDMRRLAKQWGVTFKFDGNINPSIGHGESAGQAPCASRVESEELVETELGDAFVAADTRAFLERTPLKGRPSNLYSCGAGENAFYVNSTGLLQMCLLTAHRGHDLKTGESIADSFDRGWDAFAEARKTKRQPGSPCLTCDIAALCESCPGFAHLETGDEQGVVDWLCRNTHLKARAMGVPHKCDVKHFVYSPLSQETHDGRPEKELAPEALHPA